MTDTPNPAEAAHASGLTVDVNAVVIPSLRVGDYVFATKYSDGDPADGWAIGFYEGTLGGKSSPRYMVVDEHGRQFRGNGFRRIQAISPVVGEKMIVAAHKYDHNWGEPGEVNLWDVLHGIIDEVSLG